VNELDLRHVAVADIVLRLCHGVRQAQAERLGQARCHGEGRLPRAALEQADVRPMDTRAVCEFVHRETLLASCVCDETRDDLAHVVAVLGHLGPAR